MINTYKIAKKYYEKKDYKKAYNIFSNLAMSGDLNSQMWLGSMFYYGKGVEINLEKAYHWYEKAANKNDPEALYYCAMHYLEDIGKIDIGKTYLKKSVELNYAPALTMYAYYCEYGDHGYMQNKDKAITLYRQACLLEDSKACLNLYSLMKDQKMELELRQFIRENIGYLKYFKIILNDSWKKCFSLFFSKFRISR